MKNYDNDKKETEFLKFDVVEDHKSGKLVIVEKSNRREPSKKEKNKQNTNNIWLLALIGCMLLTIATIFLLFGLFREENIPTVVEPNDSDNEEVWRGAFSDANIYENCRKSAVKINFGRGESKNTWSGFVFDSDGIIATSLTAKDAEKRGRLYVELYDGSEYAVESIVENKEKGIAFLKIPADSLTQVSFREDKLVVGEKIIAIGANEEVFDVVYGEITSQRESLIGVNIMLGENGVGAPIFDEEGTLVGMTCDCREDGTVDLAISAENAKSCFYNIIK